ncbi:hypothetical protein [Devosia sp.]|uniref:hypothetical protein n=1 Tax=Devosia sp. TaxID=1871048 RepID=UPI002FC5FAA1
MPLVFWASAEVFQPAFEAFNRARLAAEAHLNAAFAASALAALDGKQIRYVPIVMPVDMHDRYPERSRLNRKTGVYDCAPHLDYEVFVTGSFEEQIREFMRGVALSRSHLADLGASSEQIAAFDGILSEATERIVAEMPHETRH